MIRSGVYVTFWGTLATACVLICGHSRGGVKLEPTSKPVFRQAVSADQKLQITRVEKRVAHDDNVKAFCRFRKYAPADPTGAIQQTASEEESLNEKATGLIVTPVIRELMNRVRPKQITGIIRVGVKEYEFGSGGRGESIPYGDYLITPDSVGSWGSRHGAIGIANGTMSDPKLHRDRDGIEFHAATNNELETHGCVSIRTDQWPEFRKQILALVKENKGLYLHVTDHGASVSANPMEFIGETISEVTLDNVLSVTEEPVLKAPEVTPPRRCCRLMRTRARHARTNGRTTHFHGRASGRRRV